MKLRILFLSVLVLIFAFSAVGIAFAAKGGGNFDPSGCTNWFKIDNVDGPDSGSSNGVSWTITEVNGKTVFNFTTTGNVVVYKVAVKGSNDHILYNYPEGATSGSGLIAPNTGGDQQADISNVIVCYGTKIIPPPPPSDDETKTPPPSDDETDTPPPVVPEEPVGPTRTIVPAQTTSIDEELPFTGAPIELLYFAAVSGALGLALRKIKL